MTSYIGEIDLNGILDGFKERYYGTYIDDDADVTYGTNYEDDLLLSFNKTNEFLYSVPHIKKVPVGTQSDGNYPYAVRALQANMMVHTRLKSRHYGEFTDGIPGWITVFFQNSKELMEDIRHQNYVFDEDTTEGESGIGIGSWTVKNGSCAMYTNWEAGVYYGDDFPRTYVIEINGTTAGNAIGQPTFHWSRDGGYSFGSSATTATHWVGIENGLAVRWEAVGTGTMQVEYGDRFAVKCVPQNVPTKSGQVKHTTFMRG